MRNRIKTEPFDPENFLVSWTSKTSNLVKYRILQFLFRTSVDSGVIYANFSIGGMELFFGHKSWDLSLKFFTLKIEKSICNEIHNDDISWTGSSISHQSIYPRLRSTKMRKCRTMNHLEKGFYRQLQNFIFWRWSSQGSIHQSWLVLVQDSWNQVTTEPHQDREKKMKFKYCT